MIGRREFITLLGAAATWPLVARAQQAAMPVVGFLQATSFDAMADLVRGFHKGLKETGYIEGENVTIEYRFADNQLDRLPALAADLVRRRVAVIVAGSPPPVMAAKEATTSIPIVFGVPDDPVRNGSGHELRPAGWQSDRCQFSLAGVGGKAARASACAGPRRCSCCCAP
jgi:ABC-type uncharacterized transport system substrate-binding protein